LQIKRTRSLYYSHRRLLQKQTKPFQANNIIMMFNFKKEIKLITL
jgi:hypothetical protein